MMPLRMFVRMARIVRNPPSPQMVKLIFGIIGVCALLYLYDLVFGWPEALTVNGNRRLRVSPE